MPQNPVASHTAIETGKKRSGRQKSGQKGLQKAKGRLKSNSTLI
jgi:hypothetical protein